jgi:hypothetical protein
MDVYAYSVPAFERDSDDFQARILKPYALFYRFDFLPIGNFYNIRTTGNHVRGPKLDVSNE